MALPHPLISRQAQKLGAWCWGLPCTWFCVSTEGMGSNDPQAGCRPTLESGLGSQSTALSSICEVGSRHRRCPTHIPMKTMPFCPSHIIRSMAIYSQTLHSKQQKPVLADFKTKYCVYLFRVLCFTDHGEFRLLT